MILKPSLSFAGPREYRWQGLEVPAMMGKRRGTAQIATASLGVCAASYRHKILLFSTRSLSVYLRVRKSHTHEHMAMVSELTPTAMNVGVVGKALAVADAHVAVEERVAKRAGFCVDCWLRSLSATPLRFEPYHDVFPS